MLQLKLNNYPTINYLDYSPHPIVGVDEVGRGCLAGPVMAAAVCFNGNHPVPIGLTDSKLLSEKRREILSSEILNHHWVGLGSASVEEIDDINILRASLLAMFRAVQSLTQQMEKRPGHILVDGNQRIPHILDTPQTCIIKGDLRVAPISAASIVAKVTRDRWMSEQAKKFPFYQFEKHKGYASGMHKQAIEQQGPCELHRKTFRGVKEFL